MDDWRDDATCRREAPDPNRFIDATDPDEQVLLIARYCSICPVSEICFETALAVPTERDHGIWGGTTWEQRRLIRRKRRGAQKTSE